MSMSMSMIRSKSKGLPMNNIPISAAATDLASVEATIDGQGTWPLATGFLVPCRRDAAARNEEVPRNGRRLAISLSHHPGKLDGVVVMPAQTGQLFVGRP